MLADNILAKVKKGDHKAFRSLFDIYHAKVYRYLLRFTREQEEAEDLAQKVFIQIWEHRKKIDLRKSFDAYLFTIAHHLACNYLRQKARYVVDSLDDAALTLKSNETQELIDLNELSELAQREIAMLPEKRQIIFKMHFEEHFSQEEIAEKLSLSVHTVKSQLGKGSDKIRKMIHLASRIQASIMIYFLQ